MQVRYHSRLQLSWVKLAELHWSGTDVVAEGTSATAAIGVSGDPIIQGGSIEARVGRIEDIEDIEEVGIIAMIVT